MIRKRILFCLLIAAVWPMLTGPAADAEDLLGQSLHLIKERQYDDAIDVLSRILASNPEDAVAYNNRGVCFLYKGDYNRAIADYTRAIEINPEFIDAYINRGGIWIIKELYDRAISDYTRVLSINRLDSEAFYQRGVSRFRKGEYGKAITDLTRAVEINPDFALAYNQLAWIMAVCPGVEFRNGDKAVTLAQKAVKINPETSYMDTLAAAYAEAGQFEDAVKTQIEVINLLQSSGVKDEGTDYHNRLESYHARKPWREKLPEISLGARLDAFLESWREAWVHADLEAYIGCYAADASQGRLKSKASIAAHKKDLWSQKKPEEIIFGPLNINPHAQGYEVEFEQVYKAENGYLDRGQKSLILSPHSDGWRIVEERWQARIK